MVLLMAFVGFGSVYPVPDYSYNLLPYMFAAYLLLSGMWYATQSSLTGRRLRWPLCTATWNSDSGARVAARAARLARQRRRHGVR